MSTLNQRRNGVGRFVPASVALLSVIGLLLADTGSAEARADPASPTADNKYIGAKKCKSCHSKEEVGDQYGHWEKMKHAVAFESLASPAALEAGKALGIAEPQKDPKCLECHTTAFGQPEDMIKRGFKVEAGVQCESCHGPGDNHMKARMKAAAAGPDAPVVMEPGEIVLKPDEATCRGCHNSKSPTFERFCYYEAVEAILHLRPDKTPEELAARLVCGCGDSCGCVDACVDGCGVPAGEK